MSNGARYYSLDVLKIVATVFIVFHHYQQVTGAWFPGLVSFWGGRLYFGYVVELFFILSGFFMFRYIKRIESGLSFKVFFTKRVIRLLPLVFVTGLAYELFLCVYKWYFGSDWMGIQVTLWGLFIDSLGIQAGWVFENPLVNNPTWYISILVLCYVVFYLTTYIAQRLKISPFYLYIAVILVGCAVVTYKINAPFLNEMAGRGYYSFFFGILLAKVINDFPITKKSALLSACVVVFLTVVMVVKFDWALSGINFLLTFIYYPCLIAFFMWHPVAKIFDISWLGTLGKITYDVYLWHNPNFMLMYIIPALMNWSPNLMSVKAMIFYTVLNFAIGALSYRLIEKPMNQMVERKVKPLLESNR